MFVSLLASALLFASAQDVAPPAPAAPRQERYESAMRCAGVMAALSSLHAFTGNAEGKASADRNGRGFITAATGYAQPLGLTQQQLSDAFAASTSRALGTITQARGEGASAAAIDQLNVDHDACISIARGWLAEANGTS